MSISYRGDVVLSDGREFHAVAIFSERERDTNAANLISIDIYDMDGNELDADALNEEIDWPKIYSSKDYLWSVVLDLLMLEEGNFSNEEDYGYE